MENFFIDFFSSLFFVCFIWNHFCLYTLYVFKIVVLENSVRDLKRFSATVVIFVLIFTLHCKCQTTELAGLH